MDYKEFFFEKDGKFIINVEVEKNVRVNVTVSKEFYKAYKKMYYKLERDNKKYYKKNVSLDFETFFSNKYEYDYHIKEKQKENIDQNKFLEIIKSKTTAKLSLKDELLLKSMFNGHKDTEISTELGLDITRQGINNRKKRLIKKINENKK